MRMIFYILLLFTTFVNAQSLEMLEAKRVALAVTGPPELFPANNAASQGGREANATTGWSQQAGMTMTSYASDSNDGSYSIRGVAGTTSNYFRVSFEAVDGVTYDITFDSKAIVGTTMRVWFLSGYSTNEFFTINDTSWTNRSYSKTASGSGTKYIYFYSSWSGTIGDELLIDNFSIKESL